MTARKLISCCLATALVVGLCWQGGTAVAQTRVQAGVSAAVKGQIQIASLGAGVGRNAKSGEDIYLGDRISSGKNAGMQVLLLDETVFTIGAESAITIDEFVYDPATQGGVVAARVLKGAFRFVTGRIAKQRPQAMEVKLPVGAIGVRGTIAAGQVDGESSLVVLLGPGLNTDTEERLGRILVSNAGKTVEISRVGFATRIDGVGAAPIEPFLLPKADLRELTQSLDQNVSREKDESDSATGTRKAENQNTQQPQQQQQQQQQQQRQQQRQQQQQQASANGGQAQSGGGAPTSSGFSAGNTGNLAGEDQAAANQNANSSTITGGAATDGDKLINDATQGDLLNQLSPVTAGVTTFDELRRLRTGTHSYVVDTAFIQNRLAGTETNIQGDMKFRLEFDFGSRTIGGGQSSLILDTTKGGGNINLSSPIQKRSYLNDTGLASKLLDPNGVDPPQVSGSRIEVRNGNGVIAQTLKADIVYKDGFGNAGSGSGESGPRVK